MTPTLCLLMAEYNRWMNQRVYEASAKLSADELFKDRGAFFGSLFNTLNHIAVADLLWLHRFAQHDRLGELNAAMRNRPIPTALNQPLADSLPALDALRQDLDQSILALARSLTADVLAETIHYRNTEGKDQAKLLGSLLAHFFNHQTHHRGQASTLLFQAGVDVGVTDLNALIPSL